MIAGSTSVNIVSTHNLENYELNLILGQKHLHKQFGTATGLNCLNALQSLNQF